MGQKIGKRAVFYIGGYDPKSADAFFSRLEKEAERYEVLRDCKIDAGTRNDVHNDITATRYKREGGGATVETDFHFLTLDDIVLKDFAQSFPVRFWRSVKTTWDYLLSGTALQFLRHAWRFFFYFAYPPMVVAVTIALALWVALSLGPLFGPLRYAVELALFAIIVWLSVQTFWKRRFVLHLMDLWSFSRDYLRQHRSDIEAKLDRLARTMVEVTRAKDYDEVILVGHSTGGALMLDAAARAVILDPDFANNGRRVSLLTVGSTALKIGLHPAAEWYRARLQTMFDRSTIGWVEYQCHTDVINFYGTDPAELMGLEPQRNRNAPQRPVLRSIRIKQMIDDGFYRTVKRNFFRVHYQFVFGNTKPYHYDFMGICFGQVSLYDRAQEGEQA